MSNEDTSETKQVLELISLAQDEVTTYYKITGRGLKQMIYINKIYNP